MGYSGASISHGLGCKECPPGRYVPPDKAPGKSVTECVSCPQGNNIQSYQIYLRCMSKNLVQFKTPEEPGDPSISA